MAHKSFLAHDWMNKKGKWVYARAHTHHSNSIIVDYLIKAPVAVSFNNRSERHIIIFSLWTSSQGKLLCFSGGRAPSAEFCVWLNVLFFLPSLALSLSLANILAAGFEMPLQLQIDSSGFLRFYYLSFSISLNGESRAVTAALAA